MNPKLCKKGVCDPPKKSERKSCEIKDDGQLENGCNDANANHF